ncbi:MAG TPA: protocatechuate 3,4-dioxygenase subunit alpha [Ilumatobacteraceae bacterium]|nr:protocatechuate 3,4-dioxygenase subunit alpha [Ilumatobacteraceae bacterium]
MSETRAARPPTPSQTVGPYFTMRLSGEGDNVLTSPETSGTRIRIEGRVFDGDRNHIEDALIELWQADSGGRYHHPADERDDVPADPAFTGFGRCATDFHTGSYSFLTVKPGPVPHPGGGMQAPHITLTIQARGMLDPTFTRLYFPDEPAANDADPVLQSVPAHRRGTLIAEVLDTTGSSVPVYRFDIRYQGDDETVFFDV